MKASEEKRRKLIEQQQPHQNNALASELDQHFQNSNLQSSNANPTQSLTSTGGQLDHLLNQHYSTGSDNQQIVMPLHQYVQLSGNNMLSTTQPSYAQTTSTTQLPTSSSAHHPVAHYATIRRNVLERTGSTLGCTANATPRLIHRPQV